MYKKWTQFHIDLVQLCGHFLCLISEGANYPAKNVLCMLEFNFYSLQKILPLAFLRNWKLCSMCFQNIVVIIMIDMDTWNFQDVIKNFWLNEYVMKAYVTIQLNT